MKIGIDTHSIGGGQSGNETYFRSLLHGLNSAAKRHEYLLYSTHPKLLRNMGLDSAAFSTRHVRPSTPFLRVPFAVPAQALQDGLDLFHAQHIVPPFLTCRTVTTIPDLAYEHYPEFFPPFQVLWSKRLIPWSARRADHIITVSHFSKSDLIARYGIDPEKISVTYEAAGEEYYPQDRGCAREKVASRYGIERPFVLYVGRLQGRKNLVRLVEAYSRVRRGGAEHQLVLVGKKEWMAEKILSKIKELKLAKDVILTGYVDTEDLPCFYNAADVFAYPSYFEGFGLPVMEAMACGIAVITSTGSSLEEIAGDAALTVDPLDVNAITSALERLLGDGELRQELGHRGVLRSGQFHVVEMARTTLAVYERVSGAQLCSCEARKQGGSVTSDTVRPL